MANLTVDSSIYSIMKTYIKNGYEYFYDTNEKHWVLYPVDNLGNRIEWDEKDKPIEAQYFHNRKSLNKYLDHSFKK